jgi:hypothetical protein
MTTVAAAMRRAGIPNASEKQLSSPKHFSCTTRLEDKAGRI